MTEARKTVLILQIEAFYRYGTPGGFGSTMRANPDGTEDGNDYLAGLFLPLIADANEAWDKETAAGNQDQLAKDLEAQIRHVAQGGTLGPDWGDEESRVTAMVNVYLLEKHGHIPSDATNGISVALVHGSTVVNLMSAAELDAWIADSSELATGQPSGGHVFRRDEQVSDMAVVNSDAHAFIFERGRSEAFMKLKGKAISRGFRKGL